jgi:hypothetical protein
MSWCCGKKKKTWITGVCSVCKLNEGDTTQKKVFWCSACKAYICANHQGDILARGEAAGREAYSNAKKLISKFIKI